MRVPQFHFADILSGHPSSIALAKLLAASFCQLLHQKADVLTFTFGVDGGDGPYTDMENPDTGFPTPPRMS